MIHTSPNRLCPDCGTAVPLAAPEGLCPHCLALVAVASADQPSPVAHNVAEQFTSQRFFGDYELLGEIARGGMGIVLKARQLGVNRIVALKLLAGGAGAGQAFVHRFHTEAAAAARLDHPHIVPIYEFGEHEGAHFLAMRFFEGGTLQTCVAKELPTPTEAAGMIIAVANAIEHAHRRGVLHRDLKPGNVLLDAEGSPYVADFGLARLLEDDSSLTLSRAVIGTAAYLAPEVAVGGGACATTASDIYGLGAILYELLTGRPPFAAESFPALLKKIAEEEPVAPSVAAAAAAPRVISNQSSVTRTISAGGASTDHLGMRTGYSRSVSRDLETICLKSLEKEPSKRYATAQELAEDLSRFLRHEPILARPVSRFERGWRWCQRKPALAGSLAVVAILLLAMLIGSPIAIYRITQARNAEATERQRAQTEATRAEAEALNAREARNAEAAERQRARTEATRAEAEALKARQLAYASDMNWAHQAVQADEFDQALRLLNRHRPTNDFGGASSASPTSLAEKPPMAKSGTRGTRPSEIDLRGWEWRYLWRQCQGEERFILGKHTYGASAVGMLADGKTVFSAGSDKFVRLWDFESRRQTGMLSHSAAITGAAASADGRWLAAATSKDAEGQPVLLWDLATQKIDATITTNFWLRPGSITLSPDNKWLAFATAFGGVRLWDVKARSEVTNLLSIDDGSVGPLGVAFSTDSRTLAYNENVYGAILLWDIASRSVIGELNGHESFVTALAFSPDGQMLASGSHDRTARLWNLADRREIFQFTNHSGAFKSLAFSSDSRTLAMSGAGGAGRVIRLIEIKTGEEKAQLRGHLEDVTGLAFTPDGQTLLSASEDGTIRVWDVLPRAKEKSIHEFSRNSISSAWRSYGPALCLSPDGRHLLTVYTNQTFSLWDTLRLAEGERHPLPFTNTTMAAVAPGGRLAAFGSRSGELVLWDVETGQARFFPRAETNQIHLLAFSRDGRYLAADYDTKTLSQMSVGYQKRTVRVWDVGTRKETRVFDTDGQFPVSLKFSDDAKALAAGFWEGPVKLWQLDGTGGAADFIGHSGVVAGLAMSTNGQTLISAGPDIRFWDVRTRRETNKLSPRAGGEGSIALSRDGRRLAAEASDGRISIWDVASQQEVATLQGHKYEVTQLAFTPDGDHLVSASKDQLRVWRAALWTETEATEKQAGK